MTVDAEVIVIAAWSSFFGRRGVVRSTNPTMVLLEGESILMRFDPVSLAPASARNHMVAGE